MGTVNINTRDGEDILDWLTRCAEQFARNVEGGGPNPYMTAANEIRALRKLVNK
jgi:hypothetical protein